MRRNTENRYEGSVFSTDGTTFPTNGIFDNCKTVTLLLIQCTLEMSGNYAEQGFKTVSYYAKER
jgi:hypothetical protein